MRSYNMCRFCLKLIPDANIELLNEVTQKILAIVLIKLDLEVSEDPMICKVCSGILHEIYMFKSKCLYSEDIISAFFENNLKVNLRDIPIEIKNKPNTHIAEHEVICRLCIKIPKNDNYICLNKTSDKISHCRNMIQIQLPEIDLSITEEPIVCDACHASLKSYLSFATSCADVEQKIKMYCEHQQSVKEQVDLLCVLQFAENKAMDCENNFNGDLVVSQGESSKSVPVKAEKVEVEKDNPPKDQFTDGSSTEFYIKEEEVEIKSEHDQIRMEMGQPDELNDSDIVGKSGSLKNEIRIGKDESEVKTNFCPKCSYSSKYLSTIKRHMRSHSNDNIRQCALCPFTADNFLAHKTHVTSHRGPNNMFRCTECPYEANAYRNIVRHVSKHKDKSEVEMQNCPMCPFKSKSRKSLRHHQELQHDKTVKIYQCLECSWRSKVSSSYARHRLLHKMVPYSCDQCSFSTHAKKYLTRHKRENHIGLPNVMLQCTQCDFCTKWRASMHLHKKKHHSTEGKLQCEQCEFSTHNRYVLSRHLLKHTELGETEVYCCATCDYRSKYKSCVTNHMKICLNKNEDDANLTILLKCNQCDYRTKFSKYLTIHMKKHDPTSYKFKCDRCEYTTCYRQRLKRHMVSHMELGESVVYYCATCDFKSKYKNSIAYHVHSCPYKKNTYKNWHPIEVPNILSSTVFYQC